jgi:hypothetical protein
VGERCAHIALERKGSAVGVRLEHPQSIIDQHSVWQGRWRCALAPCLLRGQRDGCTDRGVYSFCMCPGGFIVPAATEVDGRRGQWHEPLAARFTSCQRCDRGAASRPEDYRRCFDWVSLQASNSNGASNARRLNLSAFLSSLCPLCSLCQKTRKLLGSLSSVIFLLARSEMHVPNSPADIAFSSASISLVRRWRRPTSVRLSERSSARPRRSK